MDSIEIFNHLYSLAQPPQPHFRIFSHLFIRYHAAMTQPTPWKIKLLYIHHHEIKNQAVHNWHSFGLVMRFIYFYLLSLQICCRKVRVSLNWIIFYLSNTVIPTVRDLLLAKTQHSTHFGKKNCNSWPESSRYIDSQNHHGMMPPVDRY